MHITASVDEQDEHRRRPVKRFLSMHITASVDEQDEEGQGARQLCYHCHVYELYIDFDLNYPSLLAVGNYITICHPPCPLNGWPR